MKLGRGDQDTMSRSYQVLFVAWKEVRIDWGEQIARVLEADEKKMTMTKREMLKTVLNESESIVKNALSNIITAV